MKNNDEQPKSFEASLEALEEIVQELERATCRSKRVWNYSSKAFGFLASARNGSVRPSAASKFCCAIIRAVRW